MARPRSLERRASHEGAKGRCANADAAAPLVGGAQSAGQAGHAACPARDPPPPPPPAVRGAEASTKAGSTSVRPRPARRSRRGKTAGAWVTPHCAWVTPRCPRRRGGLALPRAAPSPEGPAPSSTSTSLSVAEAAAAAAAATWTAPRGSLSTSSPAGAALAIVPAPTATAAAGGVGGKGGSAPRSACASAGSGASMATLGTGTVMASASSSRASACLSALTGAHGPPRPRPRAGSRRLPEKILARRAQCSGRTRAAAAGALMAPSSSPPRCAAVASAASASARAATAAQSARSHASGGGSEGGWACSATSSRVRGRRPVASRARLSPRSGASVASSRHRACTYRCAKWRTSACSAAEATMSCSTPRAARAPDASGTM
mmetsp:Transcript_22158/g.69086  ORF Transcript_22158/g.69086 Transcript_22158/m.69086 type:complete len:377 (+) Transcript_22158:912-2042(+)